MDSELPDLELLTRSIAGPTVLQRRLIAVYGWEIAHWDKNYVMLQRPPRRLEAVVTVKLDRDADLAAWTKELEEAARYG